MGGLKSCYMPMVFPETREKAFDPRLEELSRRLGMVVAKAETIPLDVYRKTLLEMLTELESLTSSINIGFSDVPPDSQADLKEKVRSLSTSIVEAWRSHSPEHRDLVDCTRYPDAPLAGFRIIVEKPPEKPIDRVDCLLRLLPRLNLLAALVPGFISPDSASLVIRAMREEVKRWGEGSGHSTVNQETTGEVLTLLERLADSEIGIWGGDGIGAALIRIIRREITAVLAAIPTGELSEKDRSGILERLSELWEHGGLFLQAFDVTLFKLELLGGDRFVFAKDRSPDKSSFERKMEWMAGLALPAELLQQYHRHGFVKGPLAAKPLESLISEISYLGWGDPTPEQKAAFTDLKQRMIGTLQSILTLLKKAGDN